MDTSEGLQIEGETFQDAVAAASAQLGLKITELGIEIIDPGASAASSTGYRPVKIRAWRRDPDASADGLKKAASGAPRRSSGGYDDGGRRSQHGGARRPAPVSYGPPPPPMDPEKITPELVEDVRGMAEGIMKHMEFPATVAAEKTRHGIRVAVTAGNWDQYLIGPEGETLAALQHLLGRMIRARMPEEAPPRLEVDVAGYRDRQIEALRELARDLIDEVRQSGDEVTTEPLPASERRIVHLEVAEVPGMETVTIGDGHYKRVVIRRASADAASKGESRA
jgi:spoIIIJ-associated protein